MNQNTITRFLNGFIIGVVLAVLLVFSGITLNNLYYSWRGCPSMAYSFWNLASLIPPYGYLNGDFCG